MSCPRCNARVLFKDEDGHWCLSCAWREPSGITKADADEERRTLRPHSGNTDNYRRFGTHSTKYLERYNT